MSLKLLVFFLFEKHTNPAAAEEATFPALFVNVYFWCATHRLTALPCTPPMPYATLSLFNHKEALMFSFKFVA